MAFANLPMLLFGGLSVAVPIVLHLIMRQRPKHQPFPAMQFLRKRQTVNTRRLRVRQFLLLTLRCAALILLAAALARPSVASTALGSWSMVGLLSALTVLAMAATLIGFSSGAGRVPVTILGLIAFLLASGTCYSAGKAIRDGGNVLLGDGAAPVAAAIVIDTSVRMDLKYDNESRLDKAQRVANWLVRQFPVDSDVAVFDSKRPRSVFSVDLGAVVTSINALKIENATTPLPKIAASAVQLLSESSRVRKELYVLTDLTQESWSKTDDDLRVRLQDQSDVTVYLIDVGIDTPQNVAIDEVQLTTETIPSGNPWMLRALIRADGPSAEHTVKVVMEDQSDAPPFLADGKLQGPKESVKDKKSVVLDDDATQWVTFKGNSLPIGLHHGYVQLERPDALEVDDRRHFTLEVRRPWRVFAASSEDAIPEFLVQHLAPFEFRAKGLAKYDFSTANIKQLGSEKLDDYEIVCLLDPPPLPAATWKRLERFVRRGGGLAVFLGREANMTFNSEAAMSILPASIKRQWRDDDGLFLAPNSTEHRLLAPFRVTDIKSVPWDTLPIFRHWGIAELNENSNVVVSFSNGQPAILERMIGEGRVVMMTTPISDDANRPSRPAWNLIPVALEGTWPFMMLADGTFEYLAKSEASRLNYEVGEMAEVAVPRSPAAERYQLISPAFDWQEITALDDRLEFGSMESLGTYRVFNDDGIRSGGFSVNLPPGTTKLDRITPEQLDDVLGPDRYQVVRNQTEIVREVDQARTGSEFYPFLMVALAIVLGLEHLISNRFYSAN